ncbi:MAG: polysaccharide deacetylase family protein [Phycisphaerales bacterium]|nr:polysaccharide deacetylase family protein [Phycisphaerales bacterium]
MHPAAVLPILAYHSIDEFGTSISVSPEVFQRQMQWFAAHGWKTLALSEAAALVRAGRPIEPRSFVLTFDDGMQSLLTHAAPVLAEHGFCAATFVVTGLVGRSPEWYRMPGPYRTIPLLDRAGLERLVGLGWELHPHTHDHPVLPHLPPDVQADQIGRSQSLVKEWFGQGGGVLAYPFGQFNADTKRAMEQCGLVAGVTLSFGSRLNPARPYEWPRVGSAWLKGSNLRQALAVTGWLERYVALRSLVKKGRERHFRQPTTETTRGLIALEG